jgi:hypothetical protein
MGHLFVAHGDLTKLACGAIAIPCDRDRNVTDVWEEVLPPDLPTGDQENWLRLPGEITDGVVDVDDHGGRRIRAFVAVEGWDTPQSVVDRMWHCLDVLSAGLKEQQGRARPLIGVPLVGTGEGGLDGRRGEVINAVLDRHRHASPPAADIALVLRDRRDFAAVQTRRRGEDWPDLSGDLKKHADHLGKLAASGQLALFLGAGVSIPAGLPNWPTLLEKLASKAGVDPPAKGCDLWDAATPIVNALGATYHQTMAEILDSTRHAVGHALLAGLRINQMVTTNLDPCMELALEPVLGDSDSFRVLARQLVSGGKPWLLKLHGDIRVDGSAVLTRKDLDEHIAQDKPLRSVVESLLLTSHLLFVGFGLQDKSFLELACGVSNVRKRAKGEEPRVTGTALALTNSDVATAEYRDLDMVHMHDDSLTEGARILEIFLDRLAWQAARQNDLATEYLLDTRYATGLGYDEEVLRALLAPLQSANRMATLSPGWSRVEAMLKSLGADCRGSAISGPFGEGRIQSTG